MGIMSSLIDFVFPIQRRLYHAQGRFVRKPTQFSSPNMQRRFAQNRLWRGTARPILQGAPSKAVYQFSSPQFRRPLARTLTQMPKPLQLPSTQKKSFWSEMFSPNINPPLARPQPKRKGFGSTALNLMRWNSMFRR